MRIVRGRNNLSIEFEVPPTPEGRTIETEFVLDYNGYGEIIGVEVLDLNRQAGPNVLGADYGLLGGEGGARVSYDEEADALYVKLSAGERSLDQTVVEGMITLDRAGRLVRLEATTTP